MYRALLFIEIIKTRGKKNAFYLDIYKLFIIFKNLIELLVILAEGLK